MSNFGLLALYIIGFIAIFYFLAVRPQQRQRRAHEAKIASVKRGDRIVTAGGIYGTVRNMDENVISLEVAKGVQIKVAKRAVSDILEKSAAPALAPREKVDEVEAAAEDVDLEGTEVIEESGVSAEEPADEVEKSK